MGLAPMTSCNTKPWYEKGLSFDCTGCGGCCEGSPGYIWVTFEEMGLIASHLKLPLQEFVDRYVRKIGDRYSLREIPEEKYRCIFLKDKKCQVYEVRPTQCKSYPFWTPILKSEQTWEQEAKSCEGISKESAWVSFEEIQKRAGF